MAYYPNDIIVTMFEEEKTPWGQDLDTVGSDDFEQSFYEFSWYQDNPDVAQPIKNALYPNGDTNAYVKEGGFAAAHASNDDKRTSSGIQIAKLPDNSGLDTPSSTRQVVQRLDKFNPLSSISVSKQSTPHL